MRILRKLFILALTMTAWAGVCHTTSPIAQDDSNNPEARYFYVRENNVLLHISPGIRAKTLARIDSGAICKAVYHIGEWVQVKFTDKREGFIHQSQLSPCLPDSEKSQQIDKSLITDLTGDSGNALLSGQSQKAGKGSSLWLWIAVVSIIINLFFSGILLKNWFKRQKAMSDYAEFKEIATIQKSREALQMEVDSLAWINKNLEKKIIQLEEQIRKV